MMGGDASNAETLARDDETGAGRDRRHTGGRGGASRDEILARDETHARSSVVCIHTRGVSRRPFQVVWYKGSSPLVVSSPAVERFRESSTRLLAVSHARDAPRLRRNPPMSAAFRLASSTDRPTARNSASSQHPSHGPQLFGWPVTHSTHDGLAAAAAHRGGQSSSAAARLARRRRGRGRRGGPSFPGSARGGASECIDEAVRE